jgi:glycosyltransferase A (GT-A) superfamily protein (DUF2064 family)
MPQNTVLIFSKIPIPGLVKTRLNQNTCLSKRDTAMIAEAMLKDTISFASKCRTDKIYIGYFPENKKSILLQIVEDLCKEAKLKTEIAYLPQKGYDFDERFSSVVNSAFIRGTINLIVLGADLPYLDPIILDKCFNYLSKENERRKMVIGPANGGGIYLVGINQSFNYKWFTKYQLFGGGVELSQFTKLCKSKEIELNLLPSYGDVDLEEDLVSLIAYLEALSISKNYIGFSYPIYTAEIIDELGLYIKHIHNGTRNRKIGKK